MSTEVAALIRNDVRQGRDAVAAQVAEQLIECHLFGELGGVGMVAAVLVHGDGDVVAAGWFGHAWDCKSGI